MTTVPDSRTTLFRRRDEREQTRLERRVAKISTPDLAQWADQTLYTLGRELSQWQKHRDVLHLEEAETCAEALLAVVREIKSRT